MSLPRIAVDAMGGDEGVRVMVAGAALALSRNPGLNFLLVGDQAQVAAAVASHPGLSGHCDVRHAPDVVTGDERPTQALRRALLTPVRGGKPVCWLSAVPRPGVLFLRRALW